jgi:hypothetical protein
MIETGNPYDSIAEPGDATCVFAPTRLRIGVVLASLMAPAWVANVIGEIERSLFGSVRVTVLIPERERTADVRQTFQRS